MTHTPPVAEGGWVHERCREDCPMSLILCRAMRELGRRPCPFISTQLIHEPGVCEAKVVLTTANGSFRTIVSRGVSGEDARKGALMTALAVLSSEEEAGDTVLRFLPTLGQDDDPWQDRRDDLRARGASRPQVACVDYAREVYGLYIQEKDRSQFFAARHRDAQARREELEAQVSVLQQRLAQYEGSQDGESSEPQEMEQDEDAATTGHSEA